MKIISEEILLSHISRIIGTGFRAFVKRSGDDRDKSVSVRFVKKLSSDIEMTVQTEEFNLLTGSFKSSVILKKTKKIDYDSEEWTVIQSCPCDEKNLLTKINAFETIARLCPDGDETEGMLFIWGIASHKNRSYKKADFYSTNDIEIIYNIEKDCFNLRIGTSYSFSNPATENRYLNALLTVFTKFMNDHNLKTDRTLGLFELSRYSLLSDYDDIETMYAVARTVISGRVGYHPS